VIEAPSKHVANPGSRSDAVDALRGIAAIGVVLYHARGFFYVGGTSALGRGLDLSWKTIEALATLPFRYGFLGVQLFFVLSGYCIHLRYAAALKQGTSAPFDLGGFAARRIWRIYPTYVVALVLSAIADVWLIRTGIATPESRHHSVGALVASLLTVQGYVAPQFTFNDVFWTLAIEVHLYALYPLLHWLSRRRGPAAVLWLTGLVSGGYILATTVLHLEQWFPHRSVRGPLFLPYWFTWAVGFYVAEVQVARAPPIRRSGWLIASGGVLGFVTYTWGYIFLAEIGWALAFGGVLLEALNRRPVPGMAAFSAVGRFSYSLYAMHVPALFLLAGMIAPGGKRFDHVWPIFLGLAVALPVAWLSYQLVERWCIGRAPRALRIFLGARDIVREVPQA